MCIPLAVLAAGALVTSAVGVGLQASGAAKAASAQKAQATLNSEIAARQAQMANDNADRAIAYGKMNAGLTLAVAGINTNLTQAVGDANLQINGAVTAANIGMIHATTAGNIALLGATTDFNVGAIAATTDFNVNSAEGAGRLLAARGEMEATSHRAAADYSELQAGDTIDAGNQAETQSRQGYAVLKSRQRAALAANGVALDEGSALRIQADTDYMADVDASTIKANAIKAALSYRVNAVNERSAATFASLDGQAAALQKHGEAVAARVAGMAGITQQYANRTVGTANYKIAEAAGVAQAQTAGDLKDADTRLTTSAQIAQIQLSSSIDARNQLIQSESDATNYRNQAEGYTGQSVQARMTASSISPFLAGATTAINGVSKIASQWYGMSQAGAFSGGGGGGSISASSGSAVLVG